MKLLLMLPLICLQALAPAWAGERAATEPVGNAARKAAPAASRTGVVGRLVERFQSARLVGLKEFSCLLQAGCATDEGRWLDAMQAQREVLDQLDVLAEAGNIEAAYERGLLGLQIAKGLRERNTLEFSTQFPSRAQVLTRRERQATEEAERYLALAAAAGHAQSCLALARFLAGEGPKPGPGGLVSHLYRCAVLGFADAGDLVTAGAAFAHMRHDLPAEDPFLIEAHSVVLRGIKPERPWRLVEPDQAEALRRMTAP